SQAGAHESRGWSMARLAREAGVDDATVARLERGTMPLANRPVAAVVATLGGLAPFGCQGIDGPNPRRLGVVRRAAR
ncbi:MAG: helix-turn-helix domain-containing protein, partial [Gemmatimonadales bacterium]